MSTPRLTDILPDLQTFAAQRLGPASLEVVGDPATQARLLGRLRTGAAAEDALLALIHRLAADHAELAAEFVQFFFEDLHRLGHGRVRIGLRRFIETGDLVQSVVGDLWPQMFDLEFRTRDAFLALLAARVRWKANDRARSFDAGRRREDRRRDIPHAKCSSASAEDTVWEPEDPGAGPATELVSREEYEAMVLALQRLPERARRLLRAHLAGEDWATIAAREDLQPESARKAVQRALAAARDWWRRHQEDTA
ncbi:MAG: RNA polymerase sigma factor [Planctomycetota bacterium]